MPPAPPAAPEAIDEVVVEADVETVACDGGGGVLGHPLTYYTFAGRSEVTCGYCGRRFLRKDGGHH
jgi:uncharacterized Zn-finger protein